MKARMRKRLKLSKNTGLSFIAMIVMMISCNTSAFLLSSQKSQKVLQSLSNRKVTTSYSEISSKADKQLREIYPPPNPLFETTNVISRIMKRENRRDIWEMTLPPIEDNDINTQNFWKIMIQKRKDGKVNKVGIDKSIEFKDSYKGAKKLISKCFDDLNFDEKSSSYHDIVNYIHDIFDHFQSTVSSPQSHGGAGAHSFRARLVSTRGPIGQKCPRWHVDHVPLRLVMSLIGPGCRYIPHDTENRSKQMILDRKALNGLDELDTERANKIIVPLGEEGVVYEALAGESIILMGRAWEREEILSAPHCSPPLGEKEGRVLLTVDVLPN